MKKKIFLISLSLSSFLFAKDGVVYKNLALPDAIKITKKQNLEIDIANFDKQVSDLGVKVANGYSYGKLDATLMGLRSNDAGNVFGFKLQSREANFGDFGFSEFLTGVGGAIQMSGGDFAKFSQMMGDPALAGTLLSTQPDDLNYPKARNHFDTKLSYMIPLYTGWKLKSYRDIAHMMSNMSTLDKEKVVAEKLFQVKKAYYDISLLLNFEKDLDRIRANIEKLYRTTVEMRKEGYAKKTDLLEVESKLANVKRMLIQTDANKELSYQFLSFLLNAKVISIKTVALDAPEFTVNINDVLDKNLDIKKAKTGLAIQSKMVDVAGSAFHPQLGAFAEYGSSDDKPFNDFSKHDRYTVGVQLSYNLFSGGTDAAKLEQEKLKRLKVAKQVELAKKGMALKFQKIKTEIKNFNAQVESLQKEVELSNEIFLSYQAQYDEGLSSINDVLIKEALQIENLLKLQQVQTQRNEKILELARLTYGEAK
jgi:outer membrane protein TolC